MTLLFLLLLLYFQLLFLFLSVLILALDLVDFYQALVCQVFAEVDVAAVVLHIRFVLIIELAIIAGALIKVA